MPPTDHGEQRLSRRSYVLAALCLLAAFALITASHFTIGELALDDASTFLVASRPLAEVVSTAMAFHSQPPLFYLALHAWLRLGDSEAVLRVLPMLFIAAAAVTLLCVSWLPRVARLTATALLLLTSYSAYLTGALRPYSLSVWLSLAATLLFVRLLGEPRRPSAYARYIVVAALMAYSVAMAMWTLVAHGVCAAIAIGIAAARDGLRAALVRYRALILALAAIALLVMPYVLLVWRLHGQLGHPSLTSSLAAAVRPRYFVSGPVYLLTLPFGLGYLALAAAACAVWTGVARREPLAGVLVAIVLIQISLTHGFLEGRSDFAFRYLAPAYPALCLLAGLGADRLLARITPVNLVVTLSAAVILAVGVATFVRSPRTAPVGPWRQVRADLRQMPGRKLVFFAIGWDALRLQYEVRDDADVQIAADAGSAWDTGGRIMTPEYVSRTIEQHVGPGTRLFYEFDPVVDRRVFDAAFAPAMARHRCRRVYQRDVPTYSRDVPDGTGALIYGYACDGQ